MNNSDFLSVAEEVKEESSIAFKILANFTHLHNSWISEKVIFGVEPEDLDKSLDLLSSKWLIKRNKTKKTFIILKDIKSHVRKLIDW